MKPILLTLAFLGSLSHASTRISFGTDAISLLNVVHQSCPSKFDLAMGGKNVNARVASAEAIIPRATLTKIAEFYILETVTGGFAPSFQSQKYAQLKIQRTGSRPIAPDQPVRWNAKCDLKLY